MSWGWACRLAGWRAVWAATEAPVWIKLKFGTISLLWPARLVAVLEAAERERDSQ